MSIPGRLASIDIVFFSFMEVQMVLESKEDRDNLQQILKEFHRQVLCGSCVLCNGMER